MRSGRNRGLCVRARECACVPACFSFSLEDVKGFAARGSLRILDFSELWAMSTTHPHNPFCKMGLHLE